MDGNAQSDPYASIAEPTQSNQNSDPYAEIAQPAAAAQAQPSDSAAPSPAVAGAGPLGTPGVDAHPAPPASMDDHSSWNAELNGVARSMGAKDSPHTLSEAVQPKALAETLGGPAVQAGEDIYSAGKEAVQGGAQLAKGAAKEFEESGGNPLYNGGKSSDPEALAQERVGGARFITGAGTLALMADAPGILNIAEKAIAGDQAARIAVNKMAVYGMTGQAAAYDAGKTAEHYDLAPETKELLQAGAFFLPTTMGTLLTTAGFKGGAGLDPEGNPAVVGATPGRGVEAGIRNTPEGVQARVKVGGATFEYPAVKDPAQVSAQNLLDQNLETLRNDAKAEAAAKDIVAGTSPEQAVANQQPKKPSAPPPAGMEQGELSPQTIANVANIIRAMPEADRPQALMEAHGKLAEWIASQGRVIIDGQIQVVKTPQQAQTLAAKLINDKIAEHDQAAQPQEQPKQGKQDTEANDKLYQRAKTVLDSNPEHQNPAALLQRNLQVDPQTASGLVDRYKSDSAATIGSKDERVVPESPATIAAQFDALAKGTIKTVMLPAGQELPEGFKPPQGAKIVKVDGDAPGAGTYITRLSPDTIKEAAKAGTHGDLLGHVQTKEDIDGTPAAAVVARQPDGTEIQSSVVNNGAAGKAQAEILAERHPGAQIAVEHPSKVIDDRIAAQQEPQGGDYDEALAEWGKQGGADPYAEIAQEQPAQPERRVDTDRRKRTDEMTPEEMRRELLTSKKVGLPNRRAFDEAEAKQGSPILGMSDADGLKALNDKYGYDAGDALLRAKADALKAAGIDAYHDKGDEFLHRGNSTLELTRKLTEARNILRDTPIKVDYDGKTLIFKGADFSFGVGKDLADAESRLKQHKADREARGERARGELRGISEVGSQEDQGNHGGPVAEAGGGAQAQPAEDGRIPGHDGDATAVLTAHGDKFAGRYRLVEADDLIPSHDFRSFQPNPKYPKGVQERNYERDEAKHRVITQAQNYDPAYTVNSNPDAVNGPPIITPDGIVLGGNSRTMSTQYAYGLGKQGEGYKDALRAKAEDFGFTAAQVGKMKRPILVREIDKPGSLDEMERIGSALNKTMMGALHPAEKAVSAGRKITVEAMNEISRLIDSTGEDATIRAAMREHGQEMMQFLVQTGALTEREAQGFRDGTGISEAGKDFIENALLGYVVNDADLMDPETGVPRAILNKLDGALAAIANIAAENDEYNIIGDLRKALNQHAEIAKRKTTVETFQKQTGMFSQRDDSAEVDALARTLAKKPTEVKKAFRSYAADVRDARVGQGGMFGGGGSQAEMFKAAFDKAKYDFGNTQAALPKDSEASKTLDALRAKVAKDDLAGKGTDVDENHVTVRYGIQGDDLAGIREYLSQQAPFEAKLGATEMFRPTKNSDGAAVIQAPVESDDLHRMNAEIEKHGDFKPSDFPDYKPHVTVAYVKPDAAQKYVGMEDTKGKAFRVESIDISDRNGNKENVKLKGGEQKTPSQPAADSDGFVKAKIVPTRAGVVAIPETPADPYQPKKEDRVQYKTKDGTVKTGRFKATFGENAVRIAPDGGGKPDVIGKGSILGPAPEPEVQANAPAPRGDVEMLDAGHPDNGLSAEVYRNPDGSFGVRFRDDESGENIGIWKYKSEETARKAFTDLMERGSIVRDQPETLADHLYSEIAAGRMPKDNNALRSLVTKFDKKLADNGRLKEAQEALEEALVRRARGIVGEGMKDPQTFDALVKLYESQPLLNIRTSTSIENQAYSTPAPLAFVASKLAGIGKSTTVYEPTAGNGMLLIGADPKNVTANELDPKRYEVLKRQGFEASNADALNSEPRDGSVDAVITNPPFGGLHDAKTGKPVKEAVDGYKIGQIDHLIAATALHAMKDKGRATMILGASRELGGQSTDDRTFLNWLYSHYNVVSHFELDGKLYNRQGAGWPTRVITLDGRMRSDKFAPDPTTIQRVGTWKEVYERFNDGLGAVQGGQPEGGSGGPVSKPEADDSQPVRSSAGSPSGRPGGIRPAGSQGTPNGIGGAQPKPLPDSEVESAAGLAGTDSDVRPDADVSRSDRLPEGAKGDSADERTAGAGGDRRDDLAPQAKKPKLPAERSDVDNEFQVKYTPASSKKDEGILIPVNMRDALSEAMSALESRVGDLDKFAQKELGYDTLEELHDALMGLQIDSVAMAIDKIKSGNGIVIGDQTGIGKGRQAAAIIRWTARNGKIPVFMTVKPQLFTEMYADLADIGSSDIQPFIVNSDEAVSLPNGTIAFGNKKATHPATLKTIAATGNLPAGRNAMFLTYSQINTDNTQRSVLSSIAEKAVFILDESHNAAGASKTGDFMQDMVSRAHGVTYLSATFAKRPDNMPIYSRTAIGEAIKDPDKLEKAMSNGGIPLQTVISNNLVRAGENFRRERSFDGVKFNEIVATSRRKEHQELADKVTEALRAIVRADRSFHVKTVPNLSKLIKGGKASGGGNKASMTVKHAEFTAVVHNFLRQLLLGLKADETADSVIAKIRADRKPVVAVENTMGSFLKEYAEANHLSVGDSLTGFDYRAVLSRGLTRTRALSITDAQGNKSKRPVDLEDLDDETLALYGVAQHTINNLELNLPVSPIDWIRQRVTAAGYRIAEITGRDLAVDYSDPDAPKLTTVPLSEQSTTGKTATVRGFNNGALDAVILNVAGATGISLHAKHDFADTRKRHMIVAQPAQDINIFMQMLGRVHRTGQVVTPDYDLLSVDLPAEKRPASLLSKKLKSLNANTSSNTESATSIKAPDMLNKYGDEIINAYLNENKDVAMSLGMLSDIDQDPGAAPDDLARTATGRLALLPVKQQEAFYRDVEQQYNDYIQYLNETNQNELEPRTFDYDADLQKSSVMVKGTNPKSPFGADAVYGEYSIKAQAKPLTGEEVQEAVDKNLAGAKPGDHMRAFVGNLDTQYKEWARTLTPGSQTEMQSGMVRAASINFIQSHPIGSTLGMEINGDAFNAVVVNIESTHKGGGNPFSMSKINLTLATTGPQPNMKVPATQLLKAQKAVLPWKASEVFAAHRPPARDTAKIVTGNLLSAYGEMRDTKGTIIHFTKKDGTVEQGILLPKKFDLAVNTAGDFQITKSSDVLRFLRQYSNQDEARTIGVADREQNIRVLRGHGDSIILSAAKAKARGGKFYLAPDITAITGDWVSHGTASMRVTVPGDKAAEAVAAVARKTSLYVPRSMSEEAEKIVKSSGGTTLRASAFGLDVAAQALGRVVKVAWDKDVAPHLPGLGKNMKEAAETVTHALVPTVGANRDVLDSLMKLKGEQERALFHVEQFFKGVERMFDSLPEEDRIDFLDRYKRGEAQVSPELDKVAEMYRTLDTATYKRIIDAQVGAMDRQARRVWDRLSSTERDDVYNELMGGRSFEMAGDREKAEGGDKDARKRLVLQRIANGVLSFKENHLRAFWKVVPGSLETREAPRGKRSPLRGDRGFTKRSTLPDVTTGLADGGVLETTNPQKLVEMGQKSALRYITALNMWKEIGDLGMRKFVRLGERAPEGWEKINDAIAKVYYPATILNDDLAKLPDVVEKAELDTRRAIIQSGEWYVEQSAARLLNNYLSKDWFQSNAIGRGLMAYKMATTGFELGLSPFHLVFEGIEAMGSQFGLGLTRAWNLGLREGDPGAFLKGLGEMASSPAAPVSMALAGGKVLKMERDFKAFAANPDNQKFLAAFPDAPHLVDLLFTGGITMGMPREYRVRMMEGARVAFKDGNYIGAVPRAIGGLAKDVMIPLFEHYIPRLKMGFALKSLAEQLAEHHDALVRGDVTEAQIARSVVDSTENRFGELNFSNLWWNNTFKGVNQLLFRSVTWKLGNWRGAIEGTAGQAKAFADPVKTMYDDAKGNRKGQDRHRSEYIPKLDLNMSWLIGMAVTTAVIGTILSKLLAGKYPWEFMEEDEARGMSTAGALALEMMHPRTGGVDSYTGLPTRISLPTGAKDFEHAAEDPRGYLHGSLSGFAGKTLDTWDNRDFYGNYVYDPNGTMYRKLADILEYNAPLPITFQQLLHGKTTGDYSQSKLGAFGMTKAPTTLDMTPLEKYMEGISDANHQPETPEQRQAHREKMQAIANGTLTGKAKRDALREAKKPYLRRMFDKLTYVQAKNAYENYATEEEKTALHHQLMVKRRNAIRRGPNVNSSSTSSAD